MSRTPAGRVPRGCEGFLIPQREKQSDLWAQVGFYASLGFIIPASAICGYVLGWLIDRWLHTRPIFSLIAAFLGGAGGLVEILKILARAEKRADQADANDSNAGPTL